jgi:hypothetical protein
MGLAKVCQLPKNVMMESGLEFVPFAKIHYKSICNPFHKWQLLNLMDKSTIEVFEKDPILKQTQGSPWY